MSFKSSNILAVNGGEKAVKTDPEDMFRWPIVTAEDENAVLGVLRRGAMSGMDVTLKFEEDLKEWFGLDYALCHNTGTAAIQAAMYASGVRIGDEVICQSLTYWGSVLQVFSLGGTVVFGDVDPDTLTLDPADIESRITDRFRLETNATYKAVAESALRAIRNPRCSKFNLPLAKYEIWRDIVLQFNPGEMVGR